jgi:hypothetical protein
MNQGNLNDFLDRTLSPGAEGNISQSYWPSSTIVSKKAGTAVGGRRRNRLAG